MIWFGRLSAISQLASRVGGGGGEGELGKILSISLHYLAQGERQGGGSVSSHCNTPTARDIWRSFS
jgi:hypothetical protein